MSEDQANCNSNSPDDKRAGEPLLAPFQFSAELLWGEQAVVAFRPLHIAPEQHLDWSSQAQRNANEEPEGRGGTQGSNESDKVQDCQANRKQQAHAHVIVFLREFYRSPACPSGA